MKFDHLEQQAATNRELIRAGKLVCKQLKLCKQTNPKKDCLLLWYGTNWGRELYLLR